MGAVLGLARGGSAVTIDAQRQLAQPLLAADAYQPATPQQPRQSSLRLPQRDCDEMDTLLVSTWHMPSAFPDDTEHLRMSDVRALLDYPPNEVLPTLRARLASQTFFARVVDVTAADRFTASFRFTATDPPVKWHCCLHEACTPSLQSWSHEYAAGKAVLGVVRKRLYKQKIVVLHCASVGSNNLLHVTVFDQPQGLSLNKFLRTQGLAVATQRQWTDEQLRKCAQTAAQHNSALASPLRARMSHEGADGAGATGGGGEAPAASAPAAPAAPAASATAADTSMTPTSRTTSAPSAAIPAAAAAASPHTSRLVACGWLR